MLQYLGSIGLSSDADSVMCLGLSSDADSVMCIGLSSDADSVMCRLRALAHGMRFSSS